MRERERVLLIQGIAGKSRGRRKMCRPVDPAALRRATRDGDVRIRQEEVIPVPNGPFRIFIQFFIALPQQQECIVITAEPHVKPVLFDTTGSAATGRTLSPKAPAELIYGNVISALVPGLSQFEGGRDGCATAANDGDLYGLSKSQCRFPVSSGSAGLCRALRKPSGSFDVTCFCDRGKTL